MNTPGDPANRVFLAGDAAHCHSTAGGQGMTTGIQDAATTGFPACAAAHLARRYSRSAGVPTARRADVRP